MNQPTLLASIAALCLCQLGCVAAPPPEMDFDPGLAPDRHPHELTDAEVVAYCDAEEAFTSMWISNEEFHRLRCMLTPVLFGADPADCHRVADVCLAGGRVSGNGGCYLNVDRLACPELTVEMLVGCVESSTIRTDEIVAQLDCAIAGDDDAIEAALFPLVTPECEAIRTLCPDLDD